MKYLFLCILIVFQCILTIQSKPLIMNKIHESEITVIKDSVKHINQGGCAYFAMKLYEIVDPYRYSLVGIEGYGHVLIKDKETGLYIDCDGISTTLYQSFMCNSFSFEPLSYDSVRYRVYNCKWNPKFMWKDTTKINNLINSLKAKL